MPKLHVFALASVIVYCMNDRFCANIVCRCTDMETEVQPVHIQQTHTMNLHGNKVLDNWQQYVYSL